jgi:ketosteroid isomerase-like protein
VVERVIDEQEWAAVQFYSEGGKGKNGVDYNMHYCRLMRVSGGKVREVVGFYDQLKVVELFS